jgi:hypothetical protein
VVGSVSANDCELCQGGKVSGTTGSTCVTPTNFANTADHTWDFRSCSDGTPVVDEAAGSELQATLMNGAVCTAEGVALDGMSAYVDLDDWEWGGAVSIEVYVRERAGYVMRGHLFFSLLFARRYVEYENFQNFVKVLEFSSGQGIDSIFLANFDLSPVIAWSVRRGETNKMMTESSWDLSVWTHIVATVSGTTMQLFKNGVLVGTNADGHEPLTTTRQNHWIGRSAWSASPNLEGTIAFVRMWHGVALEQDEVTSLYLEREL